MELILNSNFTALPYNDLLEIDGGVHWADLTVAVVCFAAGIVGVACPVVGVAATCFGGAYGIVRAFDN